MTSSRFVERTRFERQFLIAAAQARDFARDLVEEPLPVEMRYRVLLNSSSDHDATPHFRLYPEDSSPARARETMDLSAEQVVELLWRDGRVPQWVDLQVVDETGTVTVVEALCCGRFTDEEDRLYYTAHGSGPFAVKSPPLPLEYVAGARFSIHHRVECWSVAELARVSKHREKVAFLTLHGAGFDDAVMAAMATFPSAHLIELDGASVAGPGLIGLARFPRLRVARLRFALPAALSLQDLPALDRVEIMSLTGLPRRLSSAPRLAAATPMLRELSLGSSVATSADAEVRCEGLHELELAFPNIPDWVRVPASLRSLRVHAPQATDATVRQLLASCPDKLESLVLRDTPVSNAVVDQLERMTALRYLDATNTHITSYALRQLARTRPGFKCWPRV